MARVSKLERLEKGTRLPLGGDRSIEVPDAIIERFREGDAVLVVDPTEEVLHLPAAERVLAQRCVSEALAAFERLRAASDAAISRFFEGFAQRLEDEALWARVLATNTRDVAEAEARGRSTTRLRASESMRRDMIAGLRGWIVAASRRERVLERIEHDGWRAELVGAALGVVAFVFEGRPNVLADACGVLRGGNSVVFRIGRDALETAKTIMREAVRPALADAGLPEHSVCLLESSEHAAGWALFSDPRLSLAVARGSGPAVATLGALARKAGVPVSLHGTGGAWITTSTSTRGDALEQTVFDSLDRKVCNTLNVLCIVEARADELVPLALRGFERAGARLSTDYKLHVLTGSERFVPQALFTRTIAVRRAQGLVDEPQAQPLEESALGREWEWEGTPEITLAIVRDLAHAIVLFNRYSPQFIASLLSEDTGEHERFYAAINAAFVGDADTRWVDGQRALKRPELGLSSWQQGRLFGRGGVLSGDDVYTVRTRVKHL